MAAISSSIDVDASQEDTWAKISDLGASGDWMTIHVDYPEGTPELAEGNSFKEKVTMMGMPGEVTWTVKSVDEPNSFEMDGAGPMGTELKAAFRLAPSGDGTTVTMESEFAGAALAAMEGPLESASKQAAEASLAKLKEQLG